MLKYTSFVRFNKGVVPISELERFIPSTRMNFINFSFSEEDLKLDTGRKIIEFLENLERKNVNYLIDLKSLPRCIFDVKQRNKLRKFKSIRKEFVDKCSNCFFLLRKECNGIEKKITLSKHPTVFDIFSIHDILTLTKGGSGGREELRCALNRVLNKMFDIKSKNADVLYWNYPRDISEKCDYDFIFHFIEAKINLRGEEELLGNQRLITILKNTYEEHKQEYIQKESLIPRDNRWTKLIIMMGWLNLLSKQEKEFWIEKYAYYKFTETEPKLPQAWNRVWVFTEGLGIHNINDLKKIKTIDFNKSKKIICSYIPTLQDTLEQNIFSETKNVMLSKYAKIRSFCNVSFFEELDSLLI